MAIPTTEKAAQITPWSGLLDDDDHELPVELRWPTSVRTFRRMRLDAQVQSLLKATWMPILRTPWRVDGAGCRAEVAEHVAKNLGLPLVGQDSAPRALRSAGRFSWAQHLRHVVLADVYGHSVFEQVYRLDEGDGLFHIRKLLWIPPWTISEIKVATDGGLVDVRQDLPGTLPVPVSELVWHANEREGANWLGMSLLRSAFKPWLLKDRLARVGVLSVERNGMGVVVHTAPKREAMDDPEGLKAEADVAEGLKIATRVRSGESAGASLPYGAALKLEGVGGTLPDATVLIRYFDEQMARAFLGHFLNLGTETGSWALGSTFADFFTLALQAKAEEIADTTTQHVIEDLVDVNWGPNEPAPRIVFDEIGSQSPVTAEALKILRDAGLLDEDDALKQFIRVKYRLPKRDPNAPEDDAPTPPPPPPTPEESPTDA